MENITGINCPNCGEMVNVNEILYHQLEDKLKKKYQEQLSGEKKKYENDLELLNQARMKFEAEKKIVSEQIEEGVRLQLKSEKEILEKKIRSRLEEEEMEKFRTLQAELNEKSSKLKEFNQAIAEIERLKREKDEIRDSINAENERALTIRLNDEKEKIRRAEKDNFELTKREYEKKLADQMKLVEEMRRKSEQGSVQLQGEVQELAIEEWLKDNYPLDTISEIKKGSNGGDCVQTVNTYTRQNCGMIYYESKRTKTFGGDWIGKFKVDMRAKGISVGILVTQTRPKDMERMGLKEGIWICNFDEFKALCAILRETVITMSELSASQENKGDKMIMLYDYLVSPEFKAQIDAIIEGFSNMKTGLDAERRAMEKIWKIREKQIERVIINTAHMYGSIKGIAGDAIENVKALELGEGYGADDSNGETDQADTSENFTSGSRGQEAGVSKKDGLDDYNGTENKAGSGFEVRPGKEEDVNIGLFGESINGKEK
jgi:hypothetical protein